LHGEDVNRGLKELTNKRNNTTEKKIIELIYAKKNENKMMSICCDFEGVERQKNIKDIITTFIFVKLK
jgi:hypothetical protein